MTAKTATNLPPMALAARAREWAWAHGPFWLASGLWLWGFGPYVAEGWLPWLGLLALPWWAYRAGSARPAAWPLVVVVALGGLTLLIPSKAVAFLFGVGAWWWLAQGSGPRLSYLPALGLVAVSKLAAYLGLMASVPLRLLLSQMTASLLRWTGMPVQAQGNLLAWGQDEFLVDAACAGLSMLGVSFWLGLGLLAWVERARAKLLGLGAIGVGLAGLLALNLLANLFRIMVLVVLKVPAGSPLHELLGLACWGLYVLAPATWLAAQLAGDRPVGPLAAGLPGPSAPARPRVQVWVGALVLAGLGARALVPPVFPDQAHLLASTRPWPGYQAKPMAWGVLQLSKPGVLAYQKPVGAFYASTHDALICWTASGYQLTQVQLANIAGREVFTGILAKGSARFNTAWWYDNGQDVHLGQWGWRWAMLRGGPPFRVVNVSSTSPARLREVVAEVLPPLSTPPGN
jgi:exosortase N